MKSKSLNFLLLAAGTWTNLCKIAKVMALNVQLLLLLNDWRSKNLLKIICFDLSSEQKCLRVRQIRHYLEFRLTIYLITEVHLDLVLWSTEFLLNLCVFRKNNLGQNCYIALIIFTQELANLSIGNSSRCSLRKRNVPFLQHVSSM